MTTGIPCCAQMPYALEEPDMARVWTPKFRGVGIRVLDGGNRDILLLFCPWCGNMLPTSLRSEWFGELKRRKIDPYGGDAPAEFLAERWYKAPFKRRKT